MYTDIIRYKLALNVTEEQLLVAAKNIVDSWMSKQPGFISWQINKIDENYTDIVRWDSKESAAKAEKAMPTDLPADNAWYACYDPASISSVSGAEVQLFNA